MERTLPLAGKRILITRSKEQASYFSNQVQALGGTPLEVPLIQFSLPLNVERVKDELECAVYQYDWLVFTSVNGVNFFFELVNKRLPNKIAAVGNKTKEALSEWGYNAELVPAKFSAEDLVEAFKKEVNPMHSSVLLIQGNLARPILREELLRLGYNVKQITVYENHPFPLIQEEIESILSKKTDLVTFTSPSTVTNYQKVFGIQDVPVAVIGPVTKQAAEKAGYSVVICPDEYTIEGLIKAIVTFFSKSKDNLI
ncbi:uroporphyrinogen-III synthase [Sutcliffiella halmapala]|uniref:uroporphyrinogen-III synthase n=1 Tax=Sutcliffiella halmapala TaxID=79882 RepID=UPI000995537A|nr:uroporphyrinogen-III synthase [Sutcliffiella halmapala]